MSEVELVWSSESVAHRKVIEKYARKVRGGALSICSKAEKVIYGTETLATMCEAELRSVGSQAQYVYACKFCTRWHLTRQRQVREGDRS
jgi:hypothetical protein